jgi:ATP-dependent helicase/nuclease subunit A
MSQPFVDPRHPHRSILVAAAAGSGKTYQLSQRFLHLVAAGAVPASILTVTFTIKAAGEMRARILKEAADLKRDAAKRAQFLADTRAFHADRPGTRPPLSPDATADAILAQSQALRITTIDAVFLEWVAKFPYESDGDAPLPVPLALADPREAKRYDDQAFRALGAFISGRLSSADEATRAWFSGIPNLAFMDLKTKMRALSLQDTFLWYAASRQDGATPYGYHPVEDGLPATLQEAAARLRPELTAIVNAMTGMGSHAAACQALETLDVAAFQAARLFTKDLKVHGNTLKGPRRASVAAEVAAVEDLLGRVERRARLARLNDLGERYLTSYAWYAAARNAIKHQAGVAEFPDLAKGSHRLWHGDAGAGVRYLLSRTTRHMMLDEFQDTSRLQWSIFSAMAAELLAGDPVEDGGPAPSVFIVGDEKQSIYGFREADPTVMGDARAAFSTRMVETPLTASYRTAQVVLDYVNAVFELPGQRPLPGFLPHTTAVKPSGDAVVPDAGRVMLAPVARKRVDADGRVTSAVQAEAELVAGLIAAALADELSCPVYDKRAGAMRRLTPKDCAILYRSSTNAHVYEQALRARHIPCERDEDKGFFARAEIADVVATLKFLAMPADMAALATVLRSPFGALSDEAVTDLLWPTSRYGGSGDLRGPDRAAAVMQALATAEPALASTLADLMALAAGAAPHLVLTELLTRLSVLDHYSQPFVYGAREADQARHNLMRLVELVREGEDKGHVSLVTMLSYLKTLENDDETGNARTGADAVNLLTVHKSKGLEFPLVVIVDAARPWGKLDPYFVQGETRDGEPAVFFVGSRDEQPNGDSSFDALRQRATRNVADECERLLYVAMTRAEQHLFVTGHEADAAGRQGIADTAPYARLVAGFDLFAGRRDSAAATTTIAGEPCRTVVATGQAPLTGPQAATPAEPAAPDLAAAAAAAAGRATTLRPVKILTPSRQTAEGGVAASGLALAALPEHGDPRRVGTFIHAGLEAAARGVPFAEAAAFDLHVGMAQGELFAWATAQVKRAVTSEYWRALKADAARLVPEARVVHRRPGRFGDADQLVAGQVDLVVYRKDGRVRVVDFKSNRFKDVEGLEAHAAKARLAAFAREEGYDEQLRIYRDALAAIHPAAAVTAEIFFTGPAVAIAVD